MKNKAINFFKAILLPLIFYVFFGIASKGRFFSSSIIPAVLQQTVFPAIVALAIFNINELELWDLCSGAILITSSIVGGNVAKNNEFGLAGMILCVLLVSVTMCLIVGVVKYFTKIPSMVATFGMVMVFESVGAVLFNGEFSAPRAWTIFNRTPTCYILLALCLLLVYVQTNYTTFGYNVRALGHGTETAINIGVNVRNTLMKTYIFQGVLLTVAALVYISMKGSASMHMNFGTTSIGFNAIVAVLIGKSLAAYCSPLFGTIIGAFTLSLLSAGLISLGVETTWQKVANGIFLIAFLAFFENQKRVSDARARKEKAKELMQQISE